MVNLRETLRHLSVNKIAAPEFATSKTIETGMAEMTSQTYQITNNDDD